MNTTAALLKTIAVVELGAGIGLLALPSTVAGLLAGQPLTSSVPILVARVAAAALIAIGLTCWLEAVGNRPGPPRALLQGLLVYNVIVALLLVHGYVTGGANGIGLWPTVLLHAALTIWISRCLLLRDSTMRG